MRPGVLCSSKGLIDHSSLRPAGPISPLGSPAQMLIFPATKASPILRERCLKLYLTQAKLCSLSSRSALGHVGHGGDPLPQRSGGPHRSTLSLVPRDLPGHAAGSCFVPCYPRKLSQEAATPASPVVPRGARPHRIISSPNGARCSPVQFPGGIRLCCLFCLTPGGHQTGRAVGWL